MTVPYVYDTGALIAIDKDDRRLWAIHHLALEEGRQVVVPAVVVGQVWRDGQRQARLGRFLRTCEVEPTRLESAKAAGVLCDKAGTRDLVDAVVVVTALSYGAIIFTSDSGDISALAETAGVRPRPVIRRV